VLWYRALRGLTATRAAVVQLSVPVLAASAGVAMLGEALSVRLMLAAVVVFAGLLMALLTREAAAAPARR
jgi:drug/metabolite transporter (DMT)-like permease